jgi:hypothetical protein
MTATATATITEIDLPTAESIAALFREHDVLPRQNLYLGLPDEFATRPGQCAACAVGILLVHARGDASRARWHCRRSTSTVKEALNAESGLPRAFLDGLDDGFSLNDGRRTWEQGLERWSEMDGDREGPLYTGGFRVGWQAWELANATEGPLAESP